MRWVAWSHDKINLHKQLKPEKWLHINEVWAWWSSAVEYFINLQPLFRLELFSVQGPIHICCTALNCLLVRESLLGSSRLLVKQSSSRELPKGTHERAGESVQKAVTAELLAKSIHASRLVQGLSVELNNIIWWPRRGVELYNVCEIAEEKIEGDILLPPSPSQSAHPMVMEPPPVGRPVTCVPVGDGAVPKQARLGSDLS